MKNFTLNKQVATLFLCGIATFASAKPLYVSPTGDDSKDGLTPTTAVKTISKVFTLAEKNDEINISGFIDITQEPVTDIYGKGFYNLKGNQGVKVPNSIALTIIGEDKATSGFDAKSTLAAGTCCLRVDGCIAGITFKNLTFKNGDSRGDKGGAAYVRGGVVTFEDCNFFNNRNLTKDAGKGRGGAIYFEANNPAYKLTLNRCTFKDNYNKEGGDLFVQSGKFEANWCNFEGSDISDFSGSEGGVLKTTSEGATECPNIYITFNNCTIKNYTVDGNGGAFCLKHNKANSHLHFTANNCAIMLNKCKTYQGGAVILDNAQTGSTDNVKFINTFFFYNSAPNGSGGTIYIAKGMTGSTFDLINCTLLGNEAKNQPGIRFDNLAKNVTKHIYNCILEENMQTSSNTANDLSIQYADVSEADLIIKNSFIMSEDINKNVTNSAANYKADNTINYIESVLVPAYEADIYANSYNCVPLAEESPALTYGNAEYLTALNITTDQIGKTRSFAGGKCAAGSLEATAEEIDGIVNSIPEQYKKDDVKIICNGNILTVSASEKIAKINVYTQNGALVKAQNGASAQETISLPGNNFYIISVQTAGQIVNQKIYIR